MRTPPRTAIIVNPRSGSAPDPAALARDAQRAGLQAEIHVMEVGRDVTTSLSRLGDAYDVLVAAGGDGTVSSIAAVAWRAGKTLGVIPAGTLNHFARDAHIPEPLDAALTVVAEEHTRLLDVGTVNGIPFVNNVSIGAYPRMVWQRVRTQRRGVPRRLAALVAVPRTWMALRSVTMHVQLDEADFVRRTPFAFVGNGEYTVTGLGFGTRAELANGRLSLYLAPDAGRVDALLMPVRAVTGGLRTSDRFESWQASSITLEFPCPRIRVAIDGEISELDTPLCFSLERQALKTLVPAA